MIAVVLLLILTITASIEYSMGRVPICSCGHIKLWHGITWSSENSQHLSDWYTFSHVIHGYIFYLVIWKYGTRLPKKWRIVIATLIEASWEIWENTPFIINRYRTATISLDYYGDSVINSLSDILAMMGGYWIASRINTTMVIISLIIMEVFVGYMIRDNLTLNILMLIYPFPGIRSWQSGG